MNTRGWAASDEIYQGMLFLRHQVPDQLQAVGLQRWNPDHNEFNDDIYGETLFVDQGTTALALQVDSHWALILVVKDGAHVQVRISGLPQRLAERAALITCRLIEIAPHRADLQYDLTPPCEHLCGWIVLWELYSLCNMCDRRGDAMPQWTSLSERSQRLITTAMTKSQEDWHRHSTDEALLNFAFRFRLNFFIRLATRAEDHPEVTDVPLNVQPPLQADTGAAPGN